MTSLSRNSKLGYSVAQIMDILSGEGGLMEEEPVEQGVGVWILSGLVVFSVLASTTALGFSLDYEPGNDWWTVLEAACTFIFVLEIIVKVFVLERGTYFHGPLGQGITSFRYWALTKKEREKWATAAWNWLDFSITIIAVVDLAITLFLKREGEASGATMLRCFRLLRALRLINLGRITFVKDLMNIFFGVVLGTPLLFGVCLLLTSAVFLTTVLFRLAADPDPELWQDCENHSGDVLPWKCRPDALLAAEHMQEYFGTMRAGIFTLFRCITWECSSEDGRSIIVGFSKGYGFPFDFGYVLVSVFLGCGVLNVIMATFVQKTTDGLEARESTFIQRRLRDLSDRVVFKFRSLANARGGNVISMRTMSLTGGGRWPVRGEVVLHFRDFCAIFEQDRQIRGVLNDLGLHVSAVDLFHIVDTTQTGKVDMVELLDALLMVSHIKKPGTMSTLVAIRELSDRLNLLEDMTEVFVRDQVSLAATQRHSE